MATINNERHLRYILLLGEGGTLVLKKILERETNKASKSLGDLLNANKNSLTWKIEKHMLPKVFGSNANEDAWDIHLLSTVILQLFKNSLGDDEKDKITKLKWFRNEIAHASSLSMDAKEYDDDRKKLAAVLIQLSNGLDKSVHDKCQTFIKDFATGPIDIQSATARVKELSKYDDMIQTELDKLTGKLEDVSTTVKDVSVKVDSVAFEMKDVKQMLQKMIAAKTRKFRSFQVIGTEMELRGPNDHLTNMAEEYIVRLFRSALERTGGETDLTKIEHALNVILSEIESCNEVKVSGVEQKCIVIKMRCNNCQGLLELLEYLEGSHFKRRLNELVAALEKTYQAPFHLSSQITHGDLKNLLWNLGHLDEDKYGSENDEMNAERVKKVQNEAMYTRGKSRCLKVCGLPSDVTTDYLTLFFENKRIGGGVPVRKASFCDDISTAVVEFESPEGVENVLSRQNIEIMGQAVTVVLYQPELARTVEVRGPTQIVCKENIELLKRHFSNVGTVMKILYDRGRHSVLVTFETEEDVSYLCDEIQEDQIDTDDETYTVTFFRCNETNKPEAWFNNEKVASSNREFGNHNQQGTFLEKESQDQQYQKHIAKAKLSHLPEETDNEFLELYLEQELGNDVAIESIELCGNSTEAFIKFQNKKVYDVLMDKQPLDVEGQKVFVELIESKSLLQVDPKTIEVTSNKGIITEETARTIRLYFGNNSRSDGGKIVEFKFVADTETILITFESAEVAKAVSARQDHRYKDVLLNVVLVDEDLLRKRATEDCEKRKPKSIRITNLPYEIDKDTLEMVFEDAETFGENICVVDVKLDPKSSSAIIQFEEADDVARILQKNQVDIEGQTVHIEPIEEGNLEEPCTVVVTGPTYILTEDNIKSLKMYFNNKRRSGGEDVIGCWVQKPGSVEVTFKSSKVAKRVAEWDTHKFKSLPIDVNLMEYKSDTSSPEKSNKLLFSGVDEAIKDVLVLYLEDMFENLHVTDEIPGDDDSMVILEFHDSNDAQIILQRQPICIDGHYVNVSLYTDEPEKQCTIQVQGLSNIENHKDALRMYFKNTNRSGGGQIVHCEAKKDKNILLVTFETEEAARSVVNRPKHELKGTVLEVMLYNKPKEDLKTRVSESTRKILIKELPESIDKEYLELYFEAFGADEVVVENVEIGIDKSTAVVEFHDQTAVDFIMKQIPLKMKENIVSVERYREEQIDLCTIEIHGVTDIERNLEKVLMYFKNRRRSSGGEIVNNDVDIQKNIVYITFENKEVAERVVYHDHSKQGYEVMLKTKPVSDEECSTQTIDTVKVKGVDNTVSIETLTYYFESKRRSGGGPIVDIRCSDEDENVVFITFESPEDANNVSGKQHTVQNCTVRVTLYKPPPCYDDKILIKGLKSTKDALFLFLEATANVEPIRMDPHEEDDSTVLVTLKEKPNFEKLEKACNERQLEGEWLKVSKVQVTHSIVVTNIAPAVTKDTLQYYFENNRKSGGGDVDKIVVNDDDNERTCMIFFEDYKVIDDILGMHHTLGGQKLEVKRFQPALGRPEGETEREWRLPNFIEIKDADIDKISFVSISSKISKSFQEELTKTYTKVVWPSEINQKVQLHCTLTQNVKSCFRIAKGWRKAAQTAFMKLIDSIVVHRIDVFQDVRPKVMQFLMNLHVTDPSNVAIVSKKDQNHILVVGTKATADALKHDIEEGIKKILEDAEKEKQRVTEIFSNLETIETKMMIFQHFSNELEDKFDDLKVEIITEKNEIRLKGLISSVRNAQIAIYDRKSKFEIQKIDDIPKVALTLLQLDGTRDALQRKLEANSIQAIWEPFTDGIDVCCCKPSSSRKVVDIIRSIICNERIATNKEEVPDLETDKWRRKIEEIYEKHPGKVKISLEDDQTNIHICALADIHTSVKEEIQSFLRANTITSETISNAKELNLFLEKKCKKDIEDIARRYQQYYVEIRHMDQFRGLEIRGLQKGIQDATKQIQILLQRVKRKKHTVTKPGIAEHILSPKGKDSIHTIENSLECVIVVEEDVAYKQITKKELGTRSHTTFHGTTYYARQGDMTELDVDILVNPSDRKLGSSGGLGKAISSKDVVGMRGSSDGNDSMKSNYGPDYNSVSFIIIAMSDEIMSKAIKKLENSLEKEIHTKFIDDHTIRELEDIQVDEIQGIAHQCHVEMNMDKGKATIKLAGIVTNVMNASDKINKLLRDAERMEYLKNIAQWFYIEVSQTGEKVTAYDKDINMEIENAYKRQKATVEYVVNGTDFILDFGSMEEYPESNSSDKVKVIRRDLVKGGTFELPAHWDDMKGGNLRVVSLPTGCPEYTAIEKQFKDSAGQYKDANGQLMDYTVDKIERVQNKVLWEQYQSKKKQLEDQNPPGTINERELWHGTSADPVDSINAHGFNRSFCGKNATVYGDGVYFAIHAKYSCHNTYSKPDSSGIKRMYLCKVLTGVYAKGERGMRVPPSNPNGGPHALYDSVTNDMANPHMYIIFHDTQACPEYLVYFKE